MNDELFWWVYHHAPQIRRALLALLELARNAGPDNISVAKLDDIAPILRTDDRKVVWMILQTLEAEGAIQIIKIEDDAPKRPYIVTARITQSTVRILPEPKPVKQRRPKKSHRPRTQAKPQSRNRPAQAAPAKFSAEAVAAFMRVRDRGEQ